MNCQNADKDKDIVVVVTAAKVDDIEVKKNGQAVLDFSAEPAPGGQYTVTIFKAVVNPEETQIDVLVDGDVVACFTVV